MDSEIVVGSYDQVVLGYGLIKISDALQLEASFTDNSSTGCVKCMAVSHKGVLASGGTDETIRLLNIRKRKELGSLVQHNGTITCIEFHRGYMFSASEDGCLCLWSTRNWECMRTFKGHKSAINGISVHPSGKLALSVGRDKTLRTWNLMTGKVAYVTNLKQEADLVKWSPEGDTYAIVINNRIDIYCVQTAAVKRSIQAEGRIHCLEFYKNDVIVYAGEGSQVFVQNVSDDDNGGPIHVWNECDFTRIKGLCITPSPIADNEHSTMVTVATSDGWVAAVKLKDNEGAVSMELACKINSKFRLTCVSVFCKSVKPADTETETVEETVQDEVAESEEAEDVEKQPSGDASSKIKKRSKKRKFAEGLKDEKEKHETDKKKSKKQKQTDFPSEAGKEAISQKAKLQKKTGKMQKKKKKSGMKG